MIDLRSKKLRPFLTLILILAGTAVFYRPALHYGFIWDDPVWYSHAVGKAWWQTFLPAADFQFYRPLSTWYVWLFLRPDGTFAIELLHALQIGWHLLNIALAFAVSRRLGLGRWAAAAAALLFAVYPFLYQAVAWAAPNQPMAGLFQTFAWLTYLAAHPPSSRPRVGRRLLSTISLVSFLLALTVQESSVAVAFVPLLYEFLLRQQVTGWSSFLAVLKAPRARGWLFALAYVLVGGFYGLLWLQVPRQAGITQLALEPKTGLYLLQGIIYPVVGRPTGYAADFAMPDGWFLTVTAVTLLILFLLAAWHKRARLWLLALGWIGLSLAPAFVGLEYDYVYLASRLFYAPALGVALLWVTALWPSRANWPEKAGILALLLIAGQSVWLLTGFARDFGGGTAHLAQAIDQMAAGNGRALFINFPDRYQRKRPPYPYGYWGLTLAPVVVDLADFVPIVAGGAAESLSVSMPWLDADARAAGPYQVDMRGVIVQPDELVQLAVGRDAVYLSRYGEDGRFDLQLAGSLPPDVAGEDCLAVFAEMICLHELDVMETENGLEVSLAWSTERPLPPNLTIFVHLGTPGQPPLSQADGDTWRGLLPLPDWPPGGLIVERRTLPRPLAAGDLTLQIGLYNREDGQRLPLSGGDGDFYVAPVVGGKRP